jgi:ribosomal protein L44E
MNQGSLLNDITQDVSRYCGSELETAAVNALAAFLCIKIMNQDWKDEVFTPSTAVDAMWKSFICKTAQYREFCKKYCGDNFLDRTDFKMVETVIGSYAATYLLVSRMKKTFNEKFWPTPRPLFETKEKPTKRARETFEVAVSNCPRTSNIPRIERRYTVEKTTTVEQLRELASQDFRDVHGLTLRSIVLSDKLSMADCNAGPYSVFFIL